MKSKKIIEILQELDPSGEIEVTGWAGAILSIDRMPGDYDGAGYYFEECEHYPDKMFVDYKNDKIVIKEIDIKIHCIQANGNLKPEVELISTEESQEHRFAASMSSLNSDITKQHNIRISQVSPQLYRSERSYKEKKDPVIGTKNLIDYCFSLAKGGWDSEEYREEFMAKAYAKAKELKLTK